MPPPQVKDELEIPQDVEITLRNGQVEVRGPKGVLTKNLCYPGVELGLASDGRNIHLSVDFPSRKQLAMVGTIKAHLRNMVQGVTKGYQATLKIVYAHFPINVKVEQGRVKIENFYGEKKPRYAKIVGDTKVEVSGDTIIVEGVNKEHVGQTAANLEKATRIRDRCPRRFQDGIYLVKKADVKE